MGLRVRFSIANIIFSIGNDPVTITYRNGSLKDNNTRKPQYPNSSFLSGVWRKMNVVFFTFPHII